jgi:hypothetical protein
VTDLRLLPDAELLVLAVLTDCDAGTRTPADLASKVPFRAVYKLGGTAAHPMFLDKPQIHVVSYAGTRQAAANLAETARAALWQAWRTQFRTNLGAIHKVVEVTSPFEVRTGTEPDAVFRFDATYQVFTRP